ncbi:MAG: RNA 2',3'-cyclic phosphodiesterase [Bacteroidales bacterium]|nr:RNA 2',3'-cyclic phosphodiesterase [Bacteroidales bacterium]
MKRIFLAVKILPDQNFLDFFNELKDAFHYERIKWIRSDNIHITLKFFGDVEDGKIPGIISIIESVTKKINPFVIELGGTGFFGNKSNPRVVWTGIKADQDFFNLGEELLSSFELVGYLRDHGKFKPHLTLGRIKFISDVHAFHEILNDYNEDHFQELRIDKLILYESILKPQGPEYISLKSFNL